MSMKNFTVFRATLYKFLYQPMLPLVVDGKLKSGYLFQEKTSCRKPGILWFFDEIFACFGKKQYLCRRKECLTWLSLNHFCNIFAFIWLSLFDYLIRFRQGYQTA